MVPARRAPPERDGARHCATHFSNSTSLASQRAARNTRGSFQPPRRVPPRVLSIAIPTAILRRATLDRISACQDQRLATSTRKEHARACVPHVQSALPSLRIHVPHSSVASHTPHIPAQCVLMHTTLRKRALPPSASHASETRQALTHSSVPPLPPSPPLASKCALRTQPTPQSPITQCNFSPTLEGRRERALRHPAQPIIR